MRKIIGYNVSSDEKRRSNTQARSTWERTAVGSQRAQAESGTPEYYAQIRNYRYGYETPFIPSFFGFASLAGKSVLEVGIGNGIDAVEMMRSGARYTGIDVTRNHLALTQRYVDLEREQGRPLQLVQLVEGDLLESTLPDRYDVIYSFGVLHHIAHEAEYLARLRQLLAPGGELRIAVYAKWSFFNIWMVATWIVRNRMRNPLNDWQSHLAEGSQLGDGVVIKIRKRADVDRLLKAAGFEILRYSRKGFVAGYLPGIGRLFRNDGPTLAMLGSFLGWYHCFVCRTRH